MSTPLDTTPAPQKSKSPLKQCAVKLCVSITIGFMLLIGGEVLAYVKFRSQPAESSDRHLSESVYKGKTWAETFWRERRAASDNLQYYAYVVWRKVPYKGETIFVDQEGLRRTFHTQCAAYTYTIWMFGNSALWGEGSPDWETIPSLLAAEYESAGRKVCIKNYGEKAWVSTQEVIQLMLSLKQTVRQPDLVVFYDGVSDSFLPLQSELADVHSNFLSTKRLFESQKLDQARFGYLRRSYTFQALTLFANKFALAGRSGPRPAPDTDAMAHTTLSNYLKNIEIVETMADHYKFKCVFVWQPTVMAGDKPLTREEEGLRVSEEKANPGSEQLFRATYQLARQITRPDFFYLGDVFGDRQETIYADFSHPGPSGNQLVATRMFEVLQQQGH